MIEVKYAGRLGNNLFQYSLGRILAEELGFELKASPIPGFPETASRVDGHASEAPIETLHLHEIEFEKILRDRSSRKIVLDGFFQRYEYYRAHKEKIRRWLSPEAPFPKRHPKDIVLHVRKGDYLECRSIAPLSFYEEALSHSRWNQVFVCTDSPDDAFIRKFVKKFGAQVSDPGDGPMGDFRFMMSFNNIVQSASSFSWWAAFLSDAEKIFTPVPLTGYWSAETPDLDLRVNDEARYIFIRCKETYRESLPEAAFLFRKKAKLKLENLRDRSRDRVYNLRAHALGRAKHLKHKTYDHAGHLKRLAKNKLVKIDNFQSPQVSGEKFKKMADWYFAPDKKLPSAARLLFCETHNTLQLFDKIRHNKQKYVVITHDSDDRATYQMLRRMPDNVTRWFSQNADVEHSKVEGLPIGMANTLWDHGKFSRLRKVMRTKVQKTGLAYLCLDVGSYRQHREKVYEICAAKKFITLRGGQTRIPINDYIREMASHRFTLSPRGNGIDCHRTWEALHLGSIPVVERSLAMRYFEELPILYVDDFTQVDEALLERAEKTLAPKKKNLEMITFGYWKKRILATL